MKSSGFNYTYDIAKKAMNFLLYSRYFHYLFINKNLL